MEAGGGIKRIGGEGDAKLRKEERRNRRERGEDKE